jgi:hypothetical protein
MPYDWDRVVAERKYTKIDPKELRFSADRKRAATFYVSHHREDRYDDDTLYEIVVYDVAAEKEILVECRAYNVSHYTQSEQGKPIDGVELSPDGKTLVIKYDDGTAESVPVP